tara:strand:- start:14741 stop:14914 length:174 start_codon:yes stop_codon:yes gene_type:complete
MGLGEYLVIAFIAFVAGFLVTWFITEDLRDKSILITEEEVQQDCIAGLRNSAFMQKD